MAEIPLFPESGAASAGAALEDGSQGTLVQPETAGGLEQVPASAEPSEVPAPPGSVSVDPGLSGTASATDPLPPALEQLAGATAFSALSAEISPVVPGSEASTEASAEQPPGVAATITIPPLEASESSGGGEWELLVERFTTWWDSGELNRQWQRIRGPLKGVAILVTVLLALQVYATVVSTIDAIPLVSGLLELAGLTAVLQFSATRLLRRSDRQEVLAGLQRRWLDFRGRH